MPLLRPGSEARIRDFRCGCLRRHRYHRCSTRSTIQRAKQPSWWCQSAISYAPALPCSIATWSTPRTRANVLEPACTLLSATIKYKISQLRQYAWFLSILCCSANLGNLIFFLILTLDFSSIFSCLDVLLVSTSSKWLALLSLKWSNIETKERKNNYYFYDEMKIIHDFVSMSPTCSLNLRRSCIFREA